MTKFKTNETLKNVLKSMEEEGLIVPRTENNQYLAISYKGADTLITAKWNIKIYTSGNGVCTDVGVIKDYVGGRLKEPDPSLILLKIDDAGWGSPIGGILVGVSDEKTVITDVIDVKFFKPQTFEKRAYLEAFADQGWALVKNVFKATPETHRIEICTGYVNTKLRDLLREKGFDVRQTEIKGLLQDKLENEFRDYIKQITEGEDLAYDPKELHASEIGNYYHKALRYGMEKAPHLLKSGWKAIQQIRIDEYLNEG